jgi:hypothetical protein
MLEYIAISGAKSYFGSLLAKYIYNVHVPRIRTWVAFDLPSRIGKVKVEQPKSNHNFIPALPYTVYLKVLSNKMDPAEIRLHR